MKINYLHTFHSCSKFSGNRQHIVAKFLDTLVIIAKGRLRTHDWENFKLTWSNKELTNISSQLNLTLSSSLITNSIIYNAHRGFFSAYTYWVYGHYISLFSTYELNVVKYHFQSQMWFEYMILLSQNVSWFVYNGIDLNTGSLKMSPLHFKNIINNTEIWNTNSCKNVPSGKRGVYINEDINMLYGTLSYNMYYITCYYNYIYIFDNRLALRVLTSNFHVILVSVVQLRIRWPSPFFKYYKLQKYIYSTYIHIFFIQIQNYW